jgi:hypothetical protein
MAGEVTVNENHHPQQLPVKHFKKRSTQQSTMLATTSTKVSNVKSMFHDDGPSPFTNGNYI